MIPLAPPLRTAVPSDAPQLAELVNFAGDGLPHYVWTSLATNGEDPWDIGRARQAAKARDGTIVVEDRGDGAIACLTGYTVSPTYIGDDIPALFRPLLALENQVPGSWYINVLACYPEDRGHGIGTRLLRVAEQIARSKGIDRMSVIVADDNIGALRLYERCGYSHMTAAPCVREGWVTRTREWVLLTKPLA